MRQLLLTSLSLAMLVATGDRVCVASITYTILSFHGAGSNSIAGNNGFKQSDTPVQGVLAGTITTDGTLGEISSADILSWSWMGGDSTSGSSGGSTPGVTLVGVYATNNSLSLLPSVLGPGGTMQPGYIEFYNSIFLPPIDSGLTIEDVNGGITWSSYFSSPQSGGTGNSIGGAYSYPSLIFASVGGGVPPGIPEPSTITLAVLAVASLCVMRWRRRVFKA